MSIEHQDYELLSAYIDGALSDSERADLESRLEHEAELRRELDSLRQTVALIHQLPLRSAPRDFTLDARQYRRTAIPFPLSATFSALSTAAAMLLFVFGGYFLLRSEAFSLTSGMQSVQQQPPPPASLSRETSVAAADDMLLPSASPMPTQTEASLSIEAAEAEGLDEAGLGTVMQEESPADQDAALENEAFADGEAALDLAAPPAPGSDDSAGMQQLYLATASPASTLLPPTLAAESTSLAFRAQQAQATFSASAVPDVGNAEPNTSASAATQITPTAEERQRDLTPAAPEEDAQDRLEAADPAATTGSFTRIEHSPIVGMVLLVLGGLLLIVSIVTTLLRRRRT